MTPHEIITFWRAAGPERWFKADPAFDIEIGRRFESTWRRARDGQLRDWENARDGRLALVLLLDQFPRNMFRGQPTAFTTDSAALELSKRMIVDGDDLTVDPQMRRFVYMPLMHSERLADQEHCVALFENAGDPDNKKFAAIHADIVRRFGRFPHRNAILGRNSTDDETAFLDQGGFSG